MHGSFATTLAARASVDEKRGYAGQRAFDVVMAAVILIIATVSLVLPVALLAAWVRFGSAFYTQTRVGRFGKPFEIWKIRSMADGEIVWPGNILRATRVDELPQLIHVLLGKMSIVGPRPYMLSDDEKLRGINPQKRRELLEWKPGLIAPSCLKGKWEVLREKDPTFDPTTIDLDGFKKRNVPADLRFLGKAALEILNGVGKLFRGIPAE